MPSYDITLFLSFFIAFSYIRSYMYICAKLFAYIIFCLLLISVIATNTMLNFYSRCKLIFWTHIDILLCAYVYICNISCNVHMYIL